MHFEMFVKNQDDVLQDQLDFMQVNKGLLTYLAIFCHIYIGN